MAFVIYPKQAVLSKSAHKNHVCMSKSLTGVFVCKVCFYDMFTDISDTEQGEQEGKESCGKCEELPVSLEDLEFVC